MERAHIYGQVIFKQLLNVAHHPQHFLGVFREAQCRRSGDQFLSAPHEKFGMEFVGKVVKLQTDSARREMNLFRRAGHAG
jgi:hypothetical protein